MKALVLVISLVGSGCIGWTKANTIAEIAFVAEQTVDYKQTTEGISYSAEGNPLIGDHGQNVSPQAFFLTGTLLHIFVAGALPRYWREGFQAYTIAYQGYNIYDNVGNLRHWREVKQAKQKP